MEVEVRRVEGKTMAVVQRSGDARRRRGWQCKIPVMGARVWVKAGEDDGELAWGRVRCRAVVGLWGLTV